MLFQTGWDKTVHRHNDWNDFGGRHPPHFGHLVSQMSQPINSAVWLCWECETLLSQFIKFKQQVQHAYKMLLDCAKERINPSQHKTNEIKSNVSVPKADNNHFLPEPNDTTIDNENIENTCDIKEELCDYDDLDNNDDKIEHKSKKNKKVGRKKRKDVSEMYKEVKLTLKQLEEERRLLVLKEDYLNAMFKCEKCIMAFPNMDDLKDHIYLKHELNASKYNCDICGCTFATEVAYNYHAGRHLHRYKCKECGEMFVCKRAVLKHHEKTHSQGYRIDFRYDYHGEKQNGQLDQTEECSDKSTTLATTKFPCDYCEKTFRWKTSLRKHIERHSIEMGQKRKPYCEACRLTFMTTSNLQKHVRTSSKHQVQLKLRKLNDSLTEDSVTPEKQQAHIEQIKTLVNKSKQKYSCTQCDKSFQWRGNLLRHLQSHTAKANGDLICAPCNRTFSSIATYKQHMTISKKHITEDEFKYMCSDCGQKFANKTQLRDHINWEHLKNYVHKCPLCQKVFKTHTSLYCHNQVVHQKGHAELLCDHCGKHFANNAKLRTHITAIHSQQSPYRCGSCSARFKWHSCLSRHLKRIHGPHAARRRRPRNQDDAGNEDPQLVPDAVLS
ncbi:zinc finger protein 431-like isoform X2 [Galleria mellonella]|uniref:Zinc finger protein 431-like isoform X2 n=1 Tax=Galleria mellonella TaxID=7137 RepID=A0ABM3M9Z1_GALME|nr:zinc finger protein 431-like isoform X2 [Galleria mellonella]